jgi:hypothetical protein
MLEAVWVSSTESAELKCFGRWGVCQAQNQGNGD